MIGSLGTVVQTCALPISSVMTKAKANKPSKKPKTLPPTVRAEAELESRIAAALMQAFPNIGRDQLVEQRRFTVRLGHETHTFDSTALWEKAGRADILLFHGERPLAVLEIKREDLALTADDYAQAQSYANQLPTRPPLVIVSNGVDTRELGRASCRERVCQSIRYRWAP